MRAGALNNSVAFKRMDTTDDGHGNTSSGGWIEFLTVSCRLRETRGRERVDGGALAAPMSGVLTVRSSTLTRAVTEANQAVIGSVEWNIRSIVNPDMRGKWLEMVVERGVAQ